MDFSWSQIALALFGSGGFIVGAVTLFKAFNDALAARRKRIDDKRRQEITNSAEFRRLDTDESDRVVTNLWKIIEQERLENEELRAEVADLKRAEKLARPTISKVFRIIRQMRYELEQVNVMLLSQEETNIFVRRWNAVKQFADDLENLLAGDDTPGPETKEK